MAISERLALLVTLDAKGAVKSFNDLGSAADKNLGKADSKLDKMASRFQKAGAGMLATAGLAGAALYKAGQAASDLGEELSQSGQIFGKASGSIEQFAKGAATSLGQSERAAAAAANTFGLFFTNAGKSSDEAAKMSIELATLASDMASFKNTSPEDAVAALGAALRGESEPIRRYGVMLDDATLKQRALSMGLIDTTTGTLPPAIKQQAAYAEILEQTSTIQGDFARTSDGLANQQRILNAEFENAKAALGQSLAPVLADVVGGLADVAGGFTKANAATNGFLSKAAGLGTAALALGGGLTFTVGKLIDMRDTLAPLGGRLRDVEGGLTRMGKGLVGLGLVGTVAGLAAMANETSKTRVNVEGLGTALGNLNSANRQQIEDGILVAQSMGELDTVVSTLADSNVVAARRFLEVAESVGVHGAELEKLKGIVDDKKASDVQAAEDQQAYSTEVQNAVGPTDALTGAVDEQKDALDRATESTRLFKEGLDAAFGDLTLEEAADRRAQAIKDMADQFADAQDNVKSAQQRVKDLLATPVDERSDTFAADLAAAQQEVKDAIAETSRELEGNSDAALRNRENIRGAVEDIGDLIEKHRDEGASLEELQSIRYLERENLRKSLEQMGFSKDAIQHYIDAIDAIPITKETTITADTAQAQTELERFRAMVEKGADFPVAFAAAVGTGAPQRRAIGGPVTAGEIYSTNEYLGAGRGREWYAPANGTISAAGAMAGAAGTVIEQNISIHNPVPEPVSSSARSLRRAGLDMVA